MLAIVGSATLIGVQGRPITVEVHVSTGLPHFTIVGLPDASCREARDRVRAAMLSSRLTWPPRRVTVNLAPSDVRKAGTGLDLPIAIALLAADSQLDPTLIADVSFLGELGLDGSLRRVTGTLPLVDAVRDGAVVVPLAAATEAAVLGRHRILPAATLRGLVACLRGEEAWPRPPTPRPAPPPPAGPDLADVRGQPVGRLAVEIAAAGGHHLLLIGPPGAGKTMLATRLPGLLPPLDGEAALEVTRIHSAAGLPLPEGALVQRPPLRRPHHSASLVSLVGGGTSRMRPGEISCAHAQTRICSMTIKAREPATAALYVRISRDSDKLGLGVARQERECREWAKAYGWQIAEVYVDNDRSAYSGRPRPSYIRMMKDLSEGRRDGILSWHNDRLHRSPKELEPFIDTVNERAVPVHTVTGGDYDLTTAAGRMAARIVGAVARHESEHKSERSRSKHRELLADGRPSGGTRPFGLTSGRTGLVPEEAALIQQAAADLLSGRSTRSILAEWRSAGIKTTAGGTEWPSITFTRMMCSDWVAGRRGGVRAQWPAILDDITHRRLRAMFDQRKTGVSWGKTLLAGIASCGLCGSKLLSRPRGDKRACYVCATLPGGRGGCGKIRALAGPLEEDLLARLWTAVGPGRFGVAKQLSEIDDGDHILLENVERFESLARTIVEMLGSGDLSPEEFAIARRRNDEDIALARSRLAAASFHKANVAVVADAHDLEQRWHNLDIAEKRRQLSTLTREIIVGPAVRGRNRYDSDRLSVSWAF